MGYTLRPAEGEFNPYYAGYIGLVPDGDVVETLRTQLDATIGYLERLTPEAARTCPAPGEWSPLDIAIHIADTERVFAYRALWFARGAAGPLPSMEPDAFAAAASANHRTIADVVAELRAMRASTVQLLSSFSDEIWERSGEAFTGKVSVRALAWVTAGHELHHAIDLRKVAEEQ